MRPEKEQVSKVSIVAALWTSAQPLKCSISAVNRVQ